MTSIISQTHHKVPENIGYVMGQYQSHVGNMKGQIYAFNSENVIIDEFCFVLSSPVGSYAITPSVVHHLSYVICRVSSVSTITTRNNLRYQIHIWCKCSSCSQIVTPRYWLRPLY